jgi:hypothetical protein
MMANTNIIYGSDVQVTGTLDMRGNRVTGLNTDVTIYPSAPDQGATKAYVDHQKAQILASLPSLVDNGTF